MDERGWLPEGEWQPARPAVPPQVPPHVPPHVPRLPAAGWLPDPSETGLERYWDGTRWTRRIRDRDTKVERGIVPPAYALAAAEAERASRRERRGRRWFGATLTVLVLVLASSFASSAGLLPEWGNPGAAASAALAQAIAEAPPLPEDVAFPVFGSSATVTSLAAGMVAQQDDIDVTAWVREQGDAAVDDAMREALAQNPYAFVNGWTVTDYGARVEISPDYTYDAAEAERRRELTMIGVEAGLAASGARETTDQAERVRLINDYLTAVAVYDDAAFESIDASGQALPGTEELVARSQEAYGILVDGTAVCNGYAMAFLAMAHEAGLEAVIATGSDSAGVTGGLHAWNKVRVDGRWLLVDVTWNDGSPPNEDYLLIEDDSRVLATRTYDAEWVVDTALGNYSSGA